MRSSIAALVALYLGACAADREADAGLTDAGAGLDAATSADAGEPSVTDASAIDASAIDAGRDASSIDAAIGSDAGMGSDAAMGSDAGGDAGPASIALVRPRWWRGVQNVTTLGGPFVDLGPDGTVVLTVNGGYRAPTITLGEGEPNEVTFPVYFDPVVAWLAGADGELLRARLFSEDDASAPGIVSVKADDTAMTAAGSVVVHGDWHGTGYFHPDTSLQTHWSTERRLVGDSLHRAEDPFVTSWSATGEPEWLRRGRTPGPISTTWFNNAIAIAALEDGGFLVSGRYEASGFIVGDGTSGATTLTGSQLTYFARLDASGIPVWVERNTGRPWLYDGIGATPDGAAIAQVTLHADATLLADTASALPLLAETTGTRRANALVRIEPDATIAWSRRVVLDGSGASLSRHAVRGDGGVVLPGRAHALEVYDAAGAIAITRTWSDATRFVVGYAADGTPAWVTELGELEPTASAAASGGGAWIAGTVPSTATRVPVRLPDLGVLDPEASVTVLLRLDDAGAIAEAYVVGVDVPVRDLDADADSIALSGLMYCNEDTRTPYVRAVDGTLEALPDCVPDAGQRALVLVFDE